MRKMAESIAARQLQTLQLDGRNASVAYDELIRLNIRQFLEATVATGLLALLVPLLIAVAIAVKVTSPGPVLFRQQRLGLHRKKFTVLKFRTMMNNNDDRVHREYVAKLLTSDQVPDGGEKGVYKLAADPRLTPIGAALRRSSLDELPQLWNVIRGEMSLVGPRPVLEWEAALFPPSAKQRFAVRPGMTGLWQVSGRSTVAWRVALELDVSYVRNKSLWLDVKILAKTMKVIFDPTAAR
jgi:lipopolysaccharide/colanic/teichoic acid biosynthesis glycosyltransferase